MAGEWGALLKATGSQVLRWLPGRVLRWWYPVRKCSEYLAVSAHGVGPHIYVNAERSPAIANLNLTVMNELPFSVKVEGFHLKFSLESRALTSREQAITETVSAGKIRQISIDEIYLSDGQARIVREFASDCPILSITGHVLCASVVGEFKKHLQTDTRACIYRGFDKR